MGICGALIECTSVVNKGDNYQKNPIRNYKSHNKKLTYNFRGMVIHWRLNIDRERIYDYQVTMIDSQHAESTTKAKFNYEPSKLVL